MISGTPATAVNRDQPYGWVMVAVVFTLSALSFGSLAAISVFLKPLAAQFEWSRGETSLGYTAIAFSSALFGLLWGFVADRYGSRWFGVVGVFVMSASLCLLSELQSIFQFYLFYFLFGAFGNAMLSSPLFANVAFWFRQKPGLAIGLAASGGAVGQGLVPWISAHFINAWGWETAYLALAAVYLVIGLPIAFLVRESPWRISARSGPVERPEFPLSEFEVLCWLCVAVIFCCNCMAVPIVHLVPLLTDAGRSIESASGVLLVLMLAGALGRVMGGKLGDLIGALPAYMLMSLGQTVFVYWFPQVSTGTGLYLLAIVFGFTYSGVMSSILVCTRMMVSARFAGRATSLTSFFGWAGMGMGAFFGGYLFDLFGGYYWSFTFASMMGVINLLVLLLFQLRISQGWAAAQHS